MFRNLRYYHLGGDWPADEEKLSDILEEAAFEPCGPLTERSSGWIPIDADAGDRLARRVNGADLLRLRSQSRVLPAAAVNEELEARIEAYRQRMAEAPPAREKRRLKNEARDELLPKALLKSDRIWGYVDIKLKLIGIDTTQEAAAERFLRRLQTPLPGLNIRPLQFNQPVEALLTKVFFGDAPRQFVVGRECRMQDLAAPRSIVRWNDFDLTDRSIRNHVSEGMRLTHLAIEYDNRVSFVMDENGTIAKIKFVGMDEDSEDAGDALSRLDAEFVLLSGTMRQLLDDLGKQLGGVT